MKTVTGVKKKDSWWEKIPGKFFLKNGMDIFLPTVIKLCTPRVYRIRSRVGSDAANRSAQFLLDDMRSRAEYKRVWNVEIICRIEHTTGVHHCAQLGKQTKKNKTAVWLPCKRGRTPKVTKPHSRNLSSWESMRVIMENSGICNWHLRKKKKKKEPRKHGLWQTSWCTRELWICYRMFWRQYRCNLDQ